MVRHKEKDISGAFSHIKNPVNPIRNEKSAENIKKDVGMAKNQTNTSFSNSSEVNHAN